MTWNPYAPPPKPKAGSAATGPLPLHPMSVADILDGVFKLLKANFATIAVIVGCLIVPLQILAAFLERGLFGGQSIIHAFNDPSSVSTNHTSLEATGIRLGVSVLIIPFVGAAIAKVVAASYLGQQLGPGEALKATFRRAHSLFAAWITWHPVEIIGFALCIFPGIAWMTMFVMVAPVIVIEDLSFGAGLRRSWHLASKRFWPTMGVALLAGLLGSIVGNVLSTAPDIAAFVIGLHWGWLLLALGSTLSSFVVTPIAAITATLLYFDARIRTEGFDLQILAAGLARP
jgi:hypothetical protein